MHRKKVEAVPVEVDMVPLIDVIVLLLLFLIIVGDLASTSVNVQMRLPRADQAKTDCRNSRAEHATGARVQHRGGQDDREYGPSRVGERADTDRHDRHARHQPF